MQTRSASLLDAQPKIEVAMKTLRMLKEQPDVNLSILITSEKCMTNISRHYFDYKQQLFSGMVLHAGK